MDTIGFLRMLRHFPILLKAYFTGLGLVSENKTLFSGYNLKFRDIASLIFLDFHKLYILAINPGTTFAVTEIQPTPPLIKKDKNVASSPDNC